MDASHLLNNDESNCTATSMYLSFDEECTISNSFKTLDTINEISDTSNVSGNSQNMQSKDFNKLIDNRNFVKSTPLKSVNNLGNNYISPLRSARKSINEFKAVSSTPTVARFLKSVTATSNNDSKMFSHDVELQTNIPDIIQTVTNENNKENFNPEMEQAISVSSNVDEAYSSIEKTVIAMQNDEDKNELNGNVSGNNTLEDNTKELFQYDKILNEEPIHPSEFLLKDVDSSGRSEDNTITIENKSSCIMKSSDERINLTGCSAKGNVFSERSEGNPTKIINKSVSQVNKNKMNTIENTLTCVTKLSCHFNGKQINGRERSSMVYDSIEKIKYNTTKDENRSSCSMKSSRILPPGHRKTLNQVINKNNNNDSDVEVELSSLIDKMLKIANTNRNEVGKVVTTNEIKRIKDTELNNKTKELASKATIPVSVDKRRSNVSSRICTVVKTTLNSPARRAARKSLINRTSSVPQQRRSIVPLKPHENSKVGNSTRKTMLPKTITSAPVVSKIIDPTHLVKSHVTSFDDKPIKLAQSKSDKTTFVCNICKEKFRIKSLMDAHKRSHEIDIPNPTLRKKTSSTTLPSDGKRVSTAMPPPTMRTLIFGHNNQCKYCDKKFALLHALHIHLLQNCPKIPPADKKKLNFTEMNHTGKAQLPNFGNGLNKSETKHSPENLKENVSGIISKEASSSTSSLDSQYKSKQIPAHSGVVFTPRKIILCHSCKLKFKSISDYTDHNVSVHCKKQMSQQPIFE